MKVVLDTNTWLSAIVWRGEANRIIEAAINKRDKIEDLIRVILSISTIIETKTKLNLIKDDPKDNIILEAALDAKVNYIVSYDKHLINMIEFNKIKIMTARDFLKIIK